MESIYDLTPNDVLNLGPEEAVLFFRQVLWAESRRQGVPSLNVKVQANIYAPDGGLDGEVSGANPTVDGLIPKGNSGFQVKASKFSPAQCAAEIVIGKGKSATIKPKVAEILKAGGTYYMVLFADFNRDARIKREKAIKEVLKKFKVPSSKVKIITAEQLCQIGKNYLSVVTKIKHQANFGQPFSVWSKGPFISNPKNFYIDDSRTAVRDSIRHAIETKSEHIFRVDGLPGIGKTRLVYETLNIDGIRDIVVYVDAETLFGTSLSTVISNNENINAILVVDECSIGRHKQIVSLLGGFKERVSIITLSYESGKVPQPAVSFSLKPLPVEILEKMLKEEFTGLPSTAYRKLAEYSDGYPRIGSLLAGSYLKAGAVKRELLDITDTDLFNRLVFENPDNHTEFNVHKSVLRALSLFEKVGYENELEAESKWLAGRETINWSDFKRVITAQKKRGIIQGLHFLYVTPFVLRVSLVKDWWEEHGLTKKAFLELTESLPNKGANNLLQRFMDHFRYIEEVDKGKEFVKSILSEDGLFSEEDQTFLKSNLGGSFFLTLTDVDPVSALKCLERNFAAWTDDEFYLFKERRSVIWALEKICIWSDLFEGGARLLFELAKRENDNHYSNNSTGVFADLFSLGRGGVAPTEAEPKLRFKLLRSLLVTTNRNEKIILLKAIESSLRINHIIRTVGAEYQSLKKVPKLWSPKTWGELFDAYREAWELNLGLLEDQDSEVQKTVIENIIKHIREWMTTPNLSELAISTLERLFAEKLISRKQYVDALDISLRFDQKRMLPESYSKISHLKSSLSQSPDLSSKLMNAAGYFSYEDLQKEETKKSVDAVAAEVVENIKVLVGNLKWLLGAEAENSFMLGRSLWDVGLPVSVFTKILRSQDIDWAEVKNTNLVSGYLSGLYDKSQSQRDNVLSEIFLEPSAMRHLPEIIWRSGLSDESLEMVLTALEFGEIDPRSLRLFGLGGVVRQLSEERFESFIDRILEDSQPVLVELSAQLINFRYVHRDAGDLPKALGLKVITHEIFSNPPADYKFDQMTDHYWTETASALIRKFPDCRLEVFESAVKGFGHRGSLVDGHEPLAYSVLNIIASELPEAVWKIVAPMLEKKGDSYLTYVLSSWLERAISYISTKEILDWIHKDPKVRGPLVASFAPKNLSGGPDDRGITRLLLVLFGNVPHVGSSLSAHYHSGSWTGPASSRYKSLMEMFEDILSKEKDSKVRAWLQGMIASSKSQYEQSLIFEEQRGY